MVSSEACRASASTTHRKKADDDHQSCRRTRPRRDGRLSASCEQPACDRRREYRTRSPPGAVLEQRPAQKAIDDALENRKSVAAQSRRSPLAPAHAVRTVFGSRHKLNDR